MLYRNGWADTPKDEAKAKEYFDLAHNRAVEEAALNADKCAQYEKAKAWFEAAANAGQRAAYESLSKLYVESIK